MRKLNATLLNEGNKEEAILKIKDDSFAINTNDQLIKIPYSNIKGYNYDESNGVLSIVRFGGSPIELNIVKDKQLLELLNSITSKNKSDSNESIPTYESNSPKENEKELERNATIRDTDNKKTEIRQIDKNKKKATNNDGLIGLVVVIIIIGGIFFGVKSLFFNNTSGNDSNNTSEVLDGLQGTWYGYTRKDMHPDEKINDTYFKLDGKGYFTRVVKGYTFNLIEDKDYYKLENNKITFYDNTGKEVNHCTWVKDKSPNMLICSTGSTMYFMKN